MVKRPKYFLILYVIAMMLTGFSCTEDPIEIPEPDTSPPQAIVLYPIDGESVQGDIIIQARAVDNDEVDSVQFFIDQQLVSTDSSHADNIFKYTWNTGESVMVNGELVKIYSEDEFHYISVIAFDPAGNSYASVPIRS